MTDSNNKNRQSSHQGSPRAFDYEDELDFLESTTLASCSARSTFLKELQQNKKDQEVLLASFHQQRITLKEYFVQAKELARFGKYLLKLLSQYQGVPDFTEATSSLTNSSPPQAAPSTTPVPQLPEISTSLTTASSSQQHKKPRFTNKKSSALHSSHKELFVSSDENSDDSEYDCDDLENDSNDLKSDPDDSENDSEDDSEDELSKLRTPYKPPSSSLAAVLASSTFVDRHKSRVPHSSSAPKRSSSSHSFEPSQRGLGLGA